jgi:hypothetical protein
MAYDITKTDGTRLTIVADRTVDTTTPIKLLGKNYSAYGEIMAENLVQMLENFSNPTEPSNPIIGQFWWNSDSQVISVYDGKKWNAIGGSDLIGGPVNGFNTALIKDNSGQYHNAIKIHAGSSLASTRGTVVAIISADSSTYVPHEDTGLVGTFPTIGCGINMNDGDPSSGSDYGNFKIRGRAMEAEFADMAEIYRSDVELVPGNIVRLGGELEITKTVKAFDEEVFGIISTAPGFLLNSKMKMQENAYPVALKGRVPCLVTGVVRKGQRIVSSEIQGVGMATDEYNPINIIGRSLNDKTSEGLGTVEVAVGVR